MADIATGLTKFGAIVGDRTEIGCNAVINPGSVLGRDCIIYPGANFRGVLAQASVAKTNLPFRFLPAGISRVYDSCKCDDPRPTGPAKSCSTAKR